MIVILEGNDCTFKTTLGNRLAEELGIGLERGSSFESAKMNSEELFNWYVEKVNGGKSKILDRFVYSNRVYASLYEGYSLLSLNQVKTLESMIIQNYTNILLIFCHGEDRDLIRRIKIRGDKDVEPEELSRISLKYMELIPSECGLPTYYYDTSGSISIEERIQHILNILTKGWD